MEFNEEFYPGNSIHPTALISSGTVMGRGNYIGPYTVIGYGVAIGDNNRFEAHCSIGQPAEHREYFTKYGEISIGSNNVVREFVTINSSTKWVTKMGSNCVMLRGSHLSHDSVLEDGVNVSCNVLIGGESYIMEGANLGLGCILHQRTVIGAYAMVGMGAVIPKTVAIFPGRVYVGNPATYLKPNSVGLERGGVGKEALEAYEAKFLELRGQK